MSSFEGQIALVTGASRGIGREIAHALGQKGATIMGTATSQPGAEKITSELQANNIKGAGFVMDIADSASIEAAHASMVSDFGPVSILINNAGITEDNILLRMKPEQWDKVIQTNLTGVFAVTRMVLKGMVKARFGRIINLGSVVGSMGNLGQSNYAAAKAGVVGFTKSMAREVGSRGITSNVIAPGFIQTDMTDKLTEVQREQLLKQIPTGRLGTVEDIATAALFLASKETSYITGEVLHVNGGILMS